MFDDESSNIYYEPISVGKEAPNFKTNVVLGDGSIDESFDFWKYIEGKYAVLFFYPLDFTFVCPSEIIAFDHRVDDFTQRNTLVLGCSIDSHFVHSAWRNTPVTSGGIGHIKYPLVSDMNHTICQTYGIQSDAGMAYRASFLIDRERVIRHMLVNDLPLGRNVDEMLRMVDALQFSETNGEVCPAGWTQGKDGMKGTADGVAHYLSKNAADL